MKPYTNYKYLYPPRPDQAVSPSVLCAYDNGEFLAEAKFDGHCLIIFLSEKETKIMNRHGQPYNNPFDVPHEELRKLWRTDKKLDGEGENSGERWMVLCAEYMNGSKCDLNGELFDNKLVVFDVLVYNGMQLLGYSTEDRLALLDSIFYTEPYDKFVSVIDNSEHLYLVSRFNNNFEKLYNELLEGNMYEGLVLKKRSSPLYVSNKEKNSNNLNQIKFRKPTKKYQY